MRAIDHTGQSVVEQETALVKVNAPVEKRTEILQIADTYKAKVVNFGIDTLMFRVNGASEKLDSCFSLLRPYGIVELVRSGKILMARGPAET